MINNDWKFDFLLVFELEFKPDGLIGSMVDMGKLAIWYTVLRIKTQHDDYTGSSFEIIAPLYIGSLIFMLGIVYEVKNFMYKMILLCYQNIN